MNELIDILSQESQKQTHRSTRQILKETGLTQCSIVQIIHRDLGLKCLSFTNTLVASIVSFSYIYISQGSVATPLRCGGIFTNHFTANFPDSMPVKLFRNPLLFILRVAYNTWDCETRSITYAAKRVYSTARHALRWRWQATAMHAVQSVQNSGSWQHMTDSAESASLGIVSFCTVAYQSPPEADDMLALSQNAMKLHVSD